VKRNILLQFEDEDDYADVLVAIRHMHGKSTKDAAERAMAIAAICRCWQPGEAEKPTNGSPLPGQNPLPFMSNDRPKKTQVPEGIP
jgi:hypothetical protein